MANEQPDYTVIKKDNEFEIRQYTNFLTKTLSDNSYGIYLFHLLIVIFLQVLLKDLELNLNLKFFLVSIFGILLPWLLTYFLRKNSLIRKVL